MSWVGNKFQIGKEKRDTRVRNRNFEMVGEGLIGLTLVLCLGRVLCTVARVAQPELSFRTIEQRNDELITTTIVIFGD